MIVDTLLETGWSWDEWNATPKWYQAATIHTIQARRERERQESDHQAAQVRR